MDDITLCYITASEMPQHWMQYQIATLLTAARDTPIVSVSRKPMELGTNLIDDSPKSSLNIYRQLCRAAEHADTKYVAMVEDDTLYSREHFTEFRPRRGTVSYNRARWSLFSWDPIYCLRQRISNCTLIAPRDYLLDALHERLDTWPDGCPEELVGEVGRPMVDRNMQVRPRKAVEWFSTTPVIQLNHPSGTDPRQKHRWKKHGEIKAYDIPVWGKATDIVAHYYGQRP